MLNKSTSNILLFITMHKNRPQKNEIMLILLQRGDTI